uniref:Uncharacterized protein n=1 Tax=Rangifer tarandus platyrhynchus TaxID=3082113 RepID=A0ACB0EF86_RANTA|nr:unnamed protein product [Rangifer tarandus platyrhynchus]
MRREERRAGAPHPRAPGFLAEKISKRPQERPPRRDCGLLGRLALVAVVGSPAGEPGPRVMVKSVGFWELHPNPGGDSGGTRAEQSRAARGRAVATAEPGRLTTRVSVEKNCWGPSPPPRVPTWGNLEPENVMKGQEGRPPKHFIQLDGQMLLERWRRLTRPVVSFGLSRNALDVCRRACSSAGSPRPPEHPSDRRRMEICRWSARGTIHGEMSSVRTCPKAIGENAGGSCSRFCYSRQNPELPEDSASVPRELLTAGHQGT